MSSYIRLENAAFSSRIIETGVGMLVVYRLADMLKRRLFCDRMWNSTVTIFCTGYWLDLLLFTDCISVQLWQNPTVFMLPGVAIWWNFCKFCVK